MCRLSSIVSPCTTRTLGLVRLGRRRYLVHVLASYVTNEARYFERKLAQKGLVHKGVCACAHESEIERKGEGTTVRGHDGAPRPSVLANQQRYK